MALDYTFFALVFAVASALAPQGATELFVENTQLGDQVIHYRLDASTDRAPRWVIEVNQQDFGSIEQAEMEFVHHRLPNEAPGRMRIDDVVRASDLANFAQSGRLSFRGRLAGVTLELQRNEGALVLRDATGRLFVHPMRIRWRR